MPEFDLNHSITLYGLDYPDKTVVNMYMHPESIRTELKHLLSEYKIISYCLEF